MKIKKVLSIVFISLISIVFLPFNVSAGRDIAYLHVVDSNISTLDVVESNNKLTVSGTTETGVLAIAVVVYSNNNLSHMETCSVNNNTYNCKLNKNFSNGSYIVKVADYDGGDYITKNIIISSQSQINEVNPKTFDGIIIYIGIALLSLVGLICNYLYFRKNKFNN